MALSRVDQDLRADPRQSVRHAEWALWLWTAWITVSGICQSWTTIPKMMATQMMGLVSIDTVTLHELIVAGYVVGAAFSAWAIWELGLARRWARAGFLLAFVTDLIWTAAPPYHGGASYLLAIPDLGLQGAAIYLLYTLPGRLWFEGQRRAI